jgi:hypothetical protein
MAEKEIIPPAVESPFIVETKEDIPFVSYNGKREKIYGIILALVIVVLIFILLLVMNSYYSYPYYYPFSGKANTLYITYKPQSVLGRYIQVYGKVEDTPVIDKIIVDGTPYDKKFITKEYMNFDGNRNVLFELDLGSTRNIRKIEVISSESKKLMHFKVVVRDWRKYIVWFSLNFFEDITKNKATMEIGKTV